MSQEIIKKEEYASQAEEDSEVEPPYTMEEVEAFIEKHDLNDIQIQMLRAGDLTMEEILDVLNSKKIRKDYSALYRDDKPDLSELYPEEDFEDGSPEDEEVIEERWKLNENLPVNKQSNNVKAIYWDEESDTLDRDWETIFEVFFRI